MKNLKRHRGWNSIILLMMVSMSLFLFHPSISQVNKPDRLYVHFDKAFYLTGEQINYKIYILNGFPSASAFVRVEILGREGLILKEQIHRISNNTAYGYIPLPYEWEEGYYTIRCFTLWNLNFDPACYYTKEIPVFSEWEDTSSPPEPDLFTDSIRSNYTPINDAGLELRLLNRSDIHPGDSVYLHIESSSGDQANISVAVMDLNLIRPDQNMPAFISGSSHMASLAQDDPIPPERNIRIMGRLADPETGQPVRSSVISVYQPDEGGFSRLKSRDGTFTIELPPFQGSKELQFINMNPFQSEVVHVDLIPYSTYLPPAGHAEALPGRDQEVIKYMYYSKLRRKIKEIFDVRIQDSLRLTTASTSFLQPDRSYDMVNYRYIKNVEDFVSEGVPNSSTIKTVGQRKLRLFNDETKNYFMTEPWMMVDDYFILDDSLVYNIPFVEVSRIDVYNTSATLLKYFDPIMIQGGVVAVYTKNSYLEDPISEMPNLVTITGLQDVEDFEESPTPTRTDYDGPDLEPLIIWDPMALTGHSAADPYSFRMNDVTGTCLIHIEGMTNEGKLVRGEMLFTVVP